MEPEAELAPVTFSLEQAEAVAVALSYLIELDDPDLSDAAWAASERIGAVLPEGWREDRAMAGPPGEDWEPALREAVRNRRAVRLDYEDAAFARTRRVVEPLILTEVSGGLILGAFCRLRQDFRDFRLDRMAQATVLDETVAPAPGRDLDAYLLCKGR